MEAGNCVRDYVFESKIGQGGMGEVWSARHELLDRRVAIKVMAPHLLADPEFEARFIKEAQAQARLQHPSIIGATDFFREQGRYYLVMPLIEGQSLEEKLAANIGPLPVEDALRISADVLSALDYAHQRAVIHRDVKPSNILLDSEGHAYLTDFGIALMMGTDRRTRTGVAVGTVHYMSPEQIRRPKSIDHRTDVYSFGCVLYEMLTGHPPFEAEDNDEETDYVIKEMHVHQLPEPVRKWNSTVPEVLEAIVVKSLEKEPNQRFVSCGEFVRVIGLYQQEIVPDPTKKRTPTPPPVKTAPVPGPHHSREIPTQSPLPIEQNKSEFLIEKQQRKTFVSLYLGASVLVGIVVFACIREFNIWFYSGPGQSLGEFPRSFLNFLTQTLAGFAIWLSQWAVLKKYLTSPKWWITANLLAFLGTRILTQLFPSNLESIGAFWLMYIFFSAITGTIIWLYLRKYTKTRWASFLAGVGAGVTIHLIHFLIIEGFRFPLFSRYGELGILYIKLYGLYPANVFTQFNFLVSVAIDMSVRGVFQANCFIRSKNVTLRKH